MTKWPLSLFSHNSSSTPKPESEPSPTKTIPLQILSDLHLEATNAYSIFTIPPRSPYLILAGDIGRLIDYESYLSFLARQTAQFKLVFLVLGNHEFYDISFAEGLEKAQQLASEPVLNGRLRFLHRERVDIDLPEGTVTILGCTLWSSIAADKAETIRGSVQDFQKIRGWNIQSHNDAHSQDLFWVKDQVRQIREEQGSRTIVVITHPAPMTKRTPAPQYAQSPVASAFGSDVLVWRRMKEWEGLKLWVFGHTHFTTDFEKCGIRVVNFRAFFIERIPPGSLRFAVSPGMGQTKWSAVDLYHIRCFEEIADFSELEFIRRVEPLTRYNWRFRGLWQPAAFLTPTTSFREGLSD